MYEGEVTELTPEYTEAEVGGPQGAMAWTGARACGKSCRLQALGSLSETGCSSGSRPLSGYSEGGGAAVRCGGFAIHRHLLPLLRCTHAV